MSVNYNNNGTLERIAGGTFYADNPIGTILAFGGSNIPTGWHLCDGTAVSRTTYKDLFAVIGTNFGVGDGSTTFNLPDLKGEFLRGAGTNSHSGQGNGGSVGEHQDATKHPFIAINSSATFFYGVGNSPSDRSTMQNGDTYVVNSNKIKTVNVEGETSAVDPSWGATYTARPTNTSVNYIIKMFKTAVPVEVKGDGGNNYSTEERVIGTWIDGKPLYRRTITGTLPASGSWRNILLFSASELPVDKMWLNESMSFSINPNATNTSSDGTFVGTCYTPLNIAAGNNHNTRLFEVFKVNDGNIRYTFYTDNSGWGGKDFYATLEYTKTTD